MSNFDLVFTLRINTVGSVYPLSSASILVTLTFVDANFPVDPIDFFILIKNIAFSFIPFEFPFLDSFHLCFLGSEKMYNRFFSCSLTKLLTMVQYN